MAAPTVGIALAKPEASKPWVPCLASSSCAYTCPTCPTTSIPPFSLPLPSSLPDSIREMMLSQLREFTGLPADSESGILEAVERLSEDQLHAIIRLCSNSSNNSSNALILDDAQSSELVVMPVSVPLPVGLPHPPFLFGRGLAPNHVEGVAVGGEVLNTHFGGDDEDLDDTDDELLWMDGAVRHFLEISERMDSSRNQFVITFRAPMEMSTLDI